VQQYLTISRRIVLKSRPQRHQYFSTGSPGAHHSAAYPADHRGTPPEALLTLAGSGPRLNSARSIRSNRAPVAQLDRACASEAQGRRFDSCRARHLLTGFLPPPLRRIIRKHQVVFFPGLVAGEARFDQRLVGGLAVFELREPPAARRGVLF
jgi:hypothetical protein